MYAAACVYVRTDITGKRLFSTFTYAREKIDPAQLIHPTSFAIFLCKLPNLKSSYKPLHSFN